MLVRRIARPMLASIFVVGGVEALRNPAPKAAAAERASIPNPTLEQAGITDSEQAVKINAGVQIGAGLLLGLGRFPRLASLALAGTLGPTTLAGHRFWETTDPTARKREQFDALKNLSLAGGLLIAAADTAGKESLARRTKRLSGRAARKTNRKVGGAAASQRHAAVRLRGALPV